MAPRKIIIDTDPGIDDILAMLLALASSPEELDILLLSITYGNIDVQNCLHNVVTMFEIIEREMTWRKQQGQSPGFDIVTRTKPLVAVGPEHPLADQILMADYFHGLDGLANIHASHPHLSPQETWKLLFDPRDGSRRAEHTPTLFTPSNFPAHQEILRLLREHEPDTITIVAVGPLTNLALAADEDPETFLRVKEVVVMGGAIDEVGNITPTAEFNTYADAVAAARVYALSSPTPASTMPPPSPPRTSVEADQEVVLKDYPYPLSRQLKVTLFPLDVTHRHELKRGDCNKLLEPLLAVQSPLAEWVSAFMTSTFAKIESLESNVSGDAVGLSLHDPLCIWYLLACLDPEYVSAEDLASFEQQQLKSKSSTTSASSSSGSAPKRTVGTKWRLTDWHEDIRVETTGHWTRGACVVDRRPRRKLESSTAVCETDPDLLEILTADSSDAGNWLKARAGNRLGRCLETPGEEKFGRFMIQRILGLTEEQI